MSEEAKIQFDDRGSFRFQVHGRWSEWTSYQGIAVLTVEDVSYIAVSDYHSGRLPTEVVLAVRAVPTALN